MHDLVGAEHAQRVLDRLDGIGVADLAARLQPRLAEPGEAAVEPRERGLTRAVLVGRPVAKLRVERRA